MKKILTLIAACTFALGTATKLQADPLGIDSTTYELAWYFDLSGPNAGNHVDTTTHGYVASFWLKGPGMGDYVLAGMCAFIDVVDQTGWPLPSYDGMLYYNNPEFNLIPRPMGTQVWEIEVRVFKPDVLPPYGLSWDEAEIYSNTSLSNTSSQDYQDAVKLWSDAYEYWRDIGGTEYGVIGGSFSIDAGGIKPGHLPQWLNHDITADDIPWTLHLTYNPIPEPSTWLLLGAGAAFVVVMRRRKARG